MYYQRARRAAQITSHWTLSGHGAATSRPTAAFTSSTNGLTADFDATRLRATLDGTIVDYAWNFGDGTTRLRRQPEPPYAAGGTYTVTLTVTDNDGAHRHRCSTTSRSTAANARPDGGVHGHGQPTSRST